MVNQSAGSASDQDGAGAPAAVNWPRLVELIHASHSVLLTTHVRPDCDALGSTLALGAVLERLGKDVRIVAGFDVPPTLRFLDADGRIRRIGRDVPRDELAGADLLAVLDTSAWVQLGDAGEVVRTTRAKKIVLDHHVSSDDLGAEEFKDTAAEATGRIVFDLAGKLGVRLTPWEASLLFVAVATDTGWFRFASTGAATYQLAAQLAEAGAVPDQLYKQLYENDSLGRLRLTGQALARARTELDGRLIHTWLARDDFDATGALPSDSEDLVNMTLAVAGTEAAVILVEQTGGGFKISFRSRCHMDCSKVAARFGGGGHRQAAGAFLREPLETAQARVLDAVRAAMG